MGIITEKLKEYSEEYGMDISDYMYRQFELYAKMLINWNERINLTAIVNPEEIVIKHFLDSLLILNSIEISENASLIDIGTGAGFPAVPLKIVRPDLRIVLLDSLRKRITFLIELSRALGQDNETIHGRAEEYGHNKQFRESFDIVTARAVTRLHVLCEYCLPYIKVGGIFAAYKGPDIKDEINCIDKTLDLLGSRLIDIKSFNLPFDNKRNIVLIRKISQIPAKYPRKHAVITKTPL